VGAALFEIIKRKCHQNSGNGTSDPNDRVERGEASAADDKGENVTLAEEAVSKASEGSDKGAN
jgi:hypothetical protein